MWFLHSKSYPLPLEVVNNSDNLTIRLAQQSLLDSTPAPTVRSPMAKDFYETLGVDKSASDKDIRSAYRRLARRYHPDVNPTDKSAEQRFKEITNAYEVLSDPENRRKYDKYGDQWEHADQIEEMQRQQGGRAYTTGDGTRVRFEQASDIGDMGDLGSIFGDLFGRERSGPRRRAPRKGQDVDTPVDVTLEEAFHGTTRTLQLQAAETCPTCSGAGQVGNALCSECHGEGQRYRPRRLEVKVPAGVRTGSRVRIAGEGRRGIAGGKNGDLYLVVTVRPHPRFERNGDALYVDVDVPLLDAVLGGEVEVPTIDGKVVLTIRELTQNGTQVRLAGKGMPVLGSPGRRGDLFARVRVQVPGHITPEERALFEQLRDAATARA